MPDVGTGTTIAFGTSAFSAQVLDINQGDQSRPPIDVTHMGSTNFREFIVGKLVDGGTVEVEILYDPDEQPPISAVAETITITFPVPAGLATGATYIFSGFVTNWGWAAPLEDRMTATITIQVDGKGTEPAWVDAAV